MNKNLTPDTETLVNYIDNNLSLEEKKTLETILSNNKELQNELERLMLAKSVIAQNGLRIKVGDIHKEMMAELNASKKPNAQFSISAKYFQNVFKIAASLLILLIAYIGWQYSKLNSDAIFSQLSEPYKISVSRSVSTSEIVNAYLEKNYDKAIALIQALPQPDKDQLFILGQAYYAQAKFELAASTFEKIILMGESQSSTYFQDIEYYLALSQLKTGHVDDSYRILKKINTDKDHLYNGKITSLNLLKLKLLNNKTNKN